MLCLSIDIDWAHDAVIADALELIERYGVKATWMVTHATPMLEEIRTAGGHELGIHPNFNPLLEGQSGRARDTLKRMLEIVPDAVSVRSHSLARSSRLAVLFKEMGLTHESNYFISPLAGSNIQAWRDFSGLVQVPIRWEDDVRLLDASIGEPVEHLQHLDPLVVDFHPIHVFLNTTSIGDYERTRNHAQRPADLLMSRRPEGSGGSRDLLVALLETLCRLNILTCRLRDIQPGNGS